MSMAQGERGHRRRRLVSRKAATDAEIREWTTGDDDHVGHEDNAPLPRRRRRRSQIPQSVIAQEDLSTFTISVSTTLGTTLIPLPTSTLSTDAVIPNLPTLSSGFSTGTEPSQTSTIPGFVAAPAQPSTTGALTGTTTKSTALPSIDPNTSDSGIDSDSQGVSSDSEDGDDSGSETGDPEPTPRESPPSRFIKPRPDATSTGRIEPEPSRTLINGPGASSTLGPDPDASADASREAEMQHHQDTEMALIIVGCITGVVILGVGLWFLVRRYRLRHNPRADDSTYLGGHGASALLRRIPFLNSRFGGRQWTYVDESEKIPPMDEKDLLAYLPDQPKPVLPHIRVTSATLEKRYAPTSTAPSHAAFGYEASNPALPHSPTESSLSSAFGNGTFIPPTPQYPPQHHGVEPQDSGEMPQPPPRAVPNHRDTVYTQSSQASSVPRFRTVSMWVRYQAKRLAQDSVPEQGYGMMLPDEETPRRVVVAPQGVGFSH